MRSSAHVLMPVYNAQGFVIASIDSVLKQNYPELTLLLYNDGSTDQSLDIIKKYLQEYFSKNPKNSEKIKLYSDNNNQGVSNARTQLIQYSRKLNNQAYIFWLDADDQYTDINFIDIAMKKMRETKADICLYNFTVAYEDPEDPSQIVNARGLLSEKAKIPEIFQSILESGRSAAPPLKVHNLLDFTSLGWTKCYAPTVFLPTPKNCPFEDFVYVASLLEAKLITALDAKYEPILYLRRSTSICGNRSSENFTDHIPIQLKTFFEEVLHKGMGQSTYFQKLQLAQKFINTKLIQYTKTLDDIVESKTYPSLNQETVKLFTQKKTELSRWVDLNINKALQITQSKKVNLLAPLIRSRSCPALFKSDSFRLEKAKKSGFFSQPALIK